MVDNKIYTCWIMLENEATEGPTTAFHLYVLRIRYDEVKWKSCLMVYKHRIELRTICKYQKSFSIFCANSTNDDDGFHVNATWNIPKSMVYSR